MRFFDKTNIRWIITIFLLAMAYATLRYHVFKGVDWIHLPLYTFNKAISLTGLILIAFSYTAGKFRPKSNEQDEALLKLKKSFAFIGFILVGAHIIASLTILNEGYFPKFYIGSMLNLKGESSMLMGIASLVFFIIPAIASLPDMIDKIGQKRWKKMQRTGYYGLFAVSSHVLIMGWSGWWQISEWPGYLPPITLLSFIFGMLPLLFLAVKRGN